jgi:hypothetical protein
MNIYSGPIEFESITVNKKFYLKEIDLIHALFKVLDNHHLGYECVRTEASLEYYSKQKITVPWIFSYEFTSDWKLVSKVK